jgi:DNA-binding IclR family transcriptional regulator
MSKHEKAQGTVKVVTKAVRALDEFAIAGLLTPAELAERLHEPRGSIYRLVASLAENGLIEPGLKRGSFQLGIRLFELGSAAARRFKDVRAAALPEMEHLHEETGQTVFLTVRRDLEALCIERLDGQLVGVMILPVGGSIPLHGGANARALLAFESRELWKEFFEHGPLQAFTSKTPTSRAELTKELVRIRQNGYSVSEEDVIPGIASIGAPIFGRDAQLRASVSLSGPRPAILGENRQLNISLVLQTASRISAQLGYEATENSAYAASEA